MTAPAERLGFLDTLRLLGALIVVFFHFIEHRVSSETVKRLYESGVGTGAVMMFFIISGYVMPFAIRRGLNVKEFFVRRAFRLFPLYFFAIATLWIGAATHFLPYWSYMLDSSAFTWVANLLIVQDFVGAKPFLGVSWTLAIEVIWYIVFFFAVAFLGRRAAPILNLGSVAFLLALAAVSLVIQHRIPLGRPGMIYACALGLEMYRYSKGESSLRDMLAWLALFLGVTTVTNYIAFGVFAHDHVHLGTVLLSWIGAPVIFTAVLLSPALRNSRVIGSGVLPWMGTMTYSLYLLHPIAIVITYDYFAPAWQIPAMVALVSVFTLFGYYVVELPALRLGRWATKGMKTAPTALSPA